MLSLGEDSDDRSSTSTHATLEKDLKEDDCLESWVHWLQRTARDIDTKLSDLKIDYWDVLLRRRRWKWAGRVARMERDRWPIIASLWDPSSMVYRARAAATRAAGRPKTRWEDDISDFCASETLGTMDWIQLAQDYRLWNSLGEAYAIA